MAPSRPRANRLAANELLEALVASKLLEVLIASKLLEVLVPSKLLEVLVPSKLLEVLVFSIRISNTSSTPELWNSSFATKSKFARTSTSRQVANRQLGVKSHSRCASETSISFSTK